MAPQTEKDVRRLPPLDGSVTFPESVDFHAAHNPNETLYVFNHDGSDELTKVTFLEFARATHRAAHYIRPARAGRDAEVVAVVTLSDTLLYHTACLGILRAGYKPYHISPRNPASVILKLMQDVSCTKLLITRQTMPSVVAEIEAEFPKVRPGETLDIHEMPPIADIFPRLGHETAKDPFVEYPKAAKRPSLTEVMLYMHSSGSTGIPRTVPQTFENFVTWAGFDCFEQILQSRSSCTMGIMGLPPFHALGVAFQSLLPMYTLIPVALYPPTATSPTALPVTPTPDNILDHMRRTNSSATVAVPTILQLWSVSKSALDYLVTLDIVMTGGAPTPSKLGAFLTKSGVPLWMLYGGTEFGCVTRLFDRPEGDDGWEYMRFEDRIKIKWEPQGDGSYECQFLAADCHHLSFENMSDERGYATSDLFVPHPTEPNFWKLLIVCPGGTTSLHTHLGRKTVPIPMENSILTSPYVSGAIYFGREKDQPGVLIELNPQYSFEPSNPEHLANARNLIWPIIEEANAIAPSFSKIFKELILFTSPNKPMPRAGKGTVMRKAALAAYAEEIENIYAEVQSAADPGSVKPPTSWRRDNVQEWLTKELSDILPGIDPTSSLDLIDHGIDSLGVTILRRRITAALQADNLSNAVKHVPHNIVYQYPSIEKLSGFISNLVFNPNGIVSPVNRVDEIEAMIEKYSYGLEAPLPTPSSSSYSDKICVLITGTTGSLGSYLLESAMRDNRVHRVYTINRPSKSQTLLDRHLARFRETGLNEEHIFAGKVVHLEGDLHKEWLGLSEETYNQLMENVTHIIHNAWMVNFNLPLASFEPNIAGSRNLVDLSRARQALRHKSAKIIFMSSVSSMFGWDVTRGSCPEDIAEDASCCVGIGYGESKYIVERILKRCGLQTTTVRLGQIAGGEPNGAWSPNDWLPILIKSSIELGGLPLLSGVSSWVPIDSVTGTVMDMTLSPEARSVYNLVHPRPISWDTIMAYFNDILVQQNVVHHRLPDIQYKEWFSRLQERASDPTQETIERLPAIKLLDFFRGITTGRDSVQEATGGPSFSTKILQADFQEMNQLLPLSQRNVEMWVGYWKASGWLF